MTLKRIARLLALPCLLLFLGSQTGGAQSAEVSGFDAPFSNAQTGEGHPFPYIIPTEYNRTRLAQKVLLAKGYRIGKADGAWGGKTRDAVTAERKKLGLNYTRYLRPYSRLILFNEPEAREAGGLLRPGVGVVPLEARRAFLAGRPDIRAAYCTTNSDATPLTKRYPRVLSIEPEGLEKGRVIDNQPWYKSVAKSYIAANNACLVGEEASCQSIVDNLNNAVDIWGFKTAIDREEPEFEQIAFHANLALNAMINAYATARVTIDVPVKTDERIIDWMFGRVTAFKRVVRRPEGTPDFIRYGNALAQQSILPVLSMGALVGDPSTFAEGLEFYEHALSNTRVDGSLREDTLVGDMALFQETATLSAMLVTGLRAEAQGIDLFSIRRNGRTIHDLASTVLDHMEDWDSLLPYARSDQASPLQAVRLSFDPEVPYARELDELLDWMVAYHYRFPGHPNTQRIQSLSFDERICGRHATRAGKAAWSCFRALSSFSMAPKALLASPNGGLFMGFSPGCMLAREPSPF